MDEFERELRYGGDNSNEAKQSDLAVAIRSILSSQSVLVMIIMFGLRVLATISAGLVTKNSSYYQIGQWLEEYGDAEIAQEYYDILNSSGLLGTAGNIGALIGGIIGSIPTIIAIIGFILVYTKAKENSDRMNVTGFNILKVMNMIGFVCYIIAAVLCVVMPILFAAFAATLLAGDALGLGDSGMAVTSIVTGVLVIAGIISAAFLLLYIFRNYGFHKSIKCLITALTEDRIEGSISEYAAVVSIVFGVLSLLPVLTNLITADLSSAFANLGSGVYMILLGVNLNKLKRLINHTR